jgi:hypothetical protein
LGKRFGATATINNRSINQQYGGNINGLKPFGEHPDLISGLEDLTRLQAEGISLIETNIEWGKSMIIDQTLRSFLATDSGRHGSHTSRQMSTWKSRITSQVDR